VGSSWCFENDPSCVVLYSLQLLDAVAWSAVERSIAVVDPVFFDDKAVIDRRLQPPVLPPGKLRYTPKK